MAAIIKEIARQAGVSISTVSNVLNNTSGRSRASLQTRERVMKVAGDLNYSPSIMAKGLRAGRSYLVSILRFDFGEGFVTNAISGAEEVFHQHDYNMLLTSFSNPDDCRRRLEKLIHKKIDGILFMSPITPEYQEIFNDFAGKFIAVNLFYKSPLKSIPGVYVDGDEIGRKSARYLLELGHRRILLLGNRPGCAEAFKQELENKAECYQIPHETSFNGGRTAVQMMLEKKLKVSAIFAYNDDNAAGVLYEANRQGIKIPNELSVIGVNDSKIAEMTFPLLTTMAQPHFEQGKRGAELLLKLINGDDDCSDIILSPALVERESCTEILT